MAKKQSAGVAEQAEVGGLLRFLRRWADAIKANSKAHPYDLRFHLIGFLNSEYFPDYRLWAKGVELPASVKSILLRHFADWDAYTAGVGSLSAHAEDGAEAAFSHIHDVIGYLERCLDTAHPSYLVAMQRHLEFVIAMMWGGYETGGRLGWPRYLADEDTVTAALVSQKVDREYQEQRLRKTARHRAALLAEVQS